jgi:hypothetical protein
MKLLTYMLTNPRFKTQVVEITSGIQKLKGWDTVSAKGLFRLTK